MIVDGPLAQVDVTTGVLAAIMLAVFVRGIWVLPRIWRDDWPGSWERRGTPAAFPYGEQLWRGFARLPPVSIMLAGVLPIGLLLFEVAQEMEIPTAVLVIPVCAVGVCLAMVVTVVLFNRPKWAVVPHLRHQPGAAVAWWRQLRGRGTDDAPG